MNIYLTWQSIAANPQAWGFPSSLPCRLPDAEMKAEMHAGPVLGNDIKFHSVRPAHWLPAEFWVHRLNLQPVETCVRQNEPEFGVYDLFQDAPQPRYGV